MDGNNGNYLFEGLPADHYLVHVSDTNAVLIDYVKTPSGSDSGQNNNNQLDPYAINLPTNGQNLTADFGYAKVDRPNTGVIGNQVWIESDGNGVFDPADGDVGQAGVTVDLYKDGSYYGTTTTGASGDYSFTSLPPGNYETQVSDDFNVLDKYSPTVLGPNPGEDNNNQAQPYALALPQRTTDLTADFGFVDGGTSQSDSTIGNLVWLDINGDGLYTSDEPGIGDVSVELWFDTNKNGVVDAGDIPVGTEFTSDTVGIGGANYLFEGEYPTGDYLVRVTDVNNVLDNLTPTVGPNTGADFNSQTLPYAITDFNPNGAGGDIDLTADFGNAPAASNYTVVKELVSHSWPPDPARPKEDVVFDITITNTGGTWLAVVPLQDDFDPEYLQFKSADTAPNDVDTVTGLLTWDDITLAPGQDLAPLASFTVKVTFEALKDTTGLTNGVTVNTATVANAWADPDGPDDPLGPDIPLPEKSDDAGIQIILPTGLAMASFAAEWQDAEVLVTWTTLSELDIVGFNVQRSHSGAEFVTLNPELFVAASAGSNGGNIYDFRDTSALLGEAYQYRLEIMLSDGHVQRYGLQELVLAAPFRTYLGFMTN